MIMIIRGLAIGAVLASAAVGLAASASADSLTGSYTATVTDAVDTSGYGPPPVTAGDQLGWVLTACGADCTHVEVVDRPKHALDLFLQGGAWSGGPNGIGCSKTVDLGATSATEVCKSWTITYALTKTG